MYNDVIKLRKKECTGTDDYGERVYSTTDRTIYAQVRSIGMKEFYEAATVDLKPEIAFRIADYYDYQNERFVVYNTEEYRVLRTFRDGKCLDIVCYREVNTGEGFADVST